MRHRTAFGRWLDEGGMRWERADYPRPAAGGTVAAHRFHPAGPPRGVTVVAHGAGNDAFFPLIGLFKALLGRGMEVFAFDLDGHGRESTTRFSPESIPGAVPEALERARAGRDLPVHLAGHSFGGSLVLHALGGGAPVASAALVSAPLRIRRSPGVLPAEALSFFTRACLGQRVHYGVWGLLPALGPFKRAAYPVRMADASGGALRYLDAVEEVLRQLRLEEAATRVRTPTLLVYGERDRIVPVEQGARLAERIPSARLVRLPGATHYTTSFAAVPPLVEWLEERTG